jgi:hypothetical protein
MISVCLKTETFVKTARPLVSVGSARDLPSVPRGKKLENPRRKLKRLSFPARLTIEYTATFVYLQERTRVISCNRYYPYKSPHEMPQ